MATINTEKTQVVISNILEQYFLAISTRGRCARFDMNGNRDGEWLDGDFELSAKGCLMRGSEQVVVGDFERRTLSMYDCRTGKRLWSVPSLRDMAEIVLCGSDLIALTQYMHTCRFFDTQGNLVTKLMNCDKILGDSHSPRYCLARTKNSHKLRYLEIVERYGTTAMQLLDLGDQELVHGIMLSDGVVYELRPSAIIRYYTLAGKEQWSVLPPEPGGAYYAMAAVDNAVHALYRSAGLNPNEYWVSIDMSTGRVSHVSIDRARSAAEPAAGHYLVSPTGNRINLITRQFEYVPCVWE